MRLLARTLVLALALSPAACDPAAVVTSAGAPVIVSAPTYMGRVTKALGQVSRVSLSSEGAERVAKLGGKLMVDAPDKLAGAPAGVEVLDMTTDAELMTALEGDSEQAVADLLKARGVKTLVLHSQAAESADRGRKVLSRLYNHDHLELMRLWRVGDGLLYYRVDPYYEANGRSWALSPQLADAMIRYLRMRLKGGPVVRFPDVDPPGGAWTLVASVRGQGRELSVVLGQDKSLQKALEEVALDIEKDYRRNVEYMGFKPLSQAIDDLSIELSQVYERAYIEPRDEAFLESFWEMGIDGAYLMTANKKERAILPGYVSYTRSLREADRFLRHTADQGQMTERRPWRDDDAWLESMRMHTYREIPSGGVTYLYRGVPPIPLSSVTMEAVRVGIVHAGQWYMNNLVPSGQVVYKFWPSENRYSNEYNLVRHTLATWNLVQAWEMQPDRTDFLEGSRRALDFTQRYLVREPWPADPSKQMAFYDYNNNRKLGTVVVNMLGMIDLSRATGTHEWDEQMKDMGRFILHMQEEDGRFEGYYVEKGHPYYGQKNDIVPGEAALALVYLAEYFDDDSWIETMPKYFDYYEPWFDSRAKKIDENAAWPAYIYDNTTRLDLVQFGPWSVMAANAYHRRTGNDRATDFALRVARWMIDSYEWTTETSPFPDYIGGYYKLPGELPAMQAFCYAEGTAAAYQLALRARPDEAAYFEKATRETMRFALQMQFDDFQTYAFSRPEQVDGGIRYAMNETKVRIDYVHHALSAMYQWHKAAQVDPGLADSIKNGPMLPQQKLWLDKLAAQQASEDPAAGKPSYRVFVAPVEPVPEQDGAEEAGE